MKHALSVLEFRRALERVGARAASPLGRQAVESRMPSADVEEVRRELGRVSETQAFLSDHPAWGMPVVPDARLALDRLLVDGTVLEPLELWALCGLLGASRAVGDELDARPERHPALAPLRALLHRDQPVEESIARAVDETGQ